MLLHKLKQQGIFLGTEQTPRKRTQKKEANWINRNERVSHSKRNKGDGVATEREDVGKKKEG
jgi:hypothetical protein